MIEAALKLPKTKIKNTEKLTQSDLLKVFGEADLVDTRQEQEELDLDGKANGNGHAKVIRRADQIDLALFHSHEFHVLLDHDDPFAAIGKPPYRVESEKEDEEEFETDDILALYNELMEVGQKGITMQRYKGLGEMNAEQLKETTMDPDNRTMLQVQADDNVQAGSIFELLMGDQVEPRKEFIQQHAADVRNLDF